MTDPFPLGRLCAVHTITSLQYSVSGNSIWSEGRRKWPLGAKPSYRSSEKNASSSCQPLHVFSPPPEGTATCIPWHHSGRQARRTVRGEQIRAEAGMRESEKRGRKNSRNTSEQERPGRRDEENYTRSTSLRDALPSIYLSNLKSKAINQADDVVSSLLRWLRNSFILLLCLVPSSGLFTRQWIAS